ncbi:MAG TPA: hypothetical protein VHE34_30975 [Puia sp.]|uniref:hypothetical protein n=1 Tax=Puia sp. TaxID=2045100 RepID=UPI002BA2D708|nr:hypothetical protein [Puia sp.]HVU99700.1 hypothetical protein [Puia sp.]
MIVLLVSLSAVFLSYLFDKKKTVAGVKAGLQMFLQVLPSVFSLIWVTGALIYLLPAGVIAHYLGREAGFSGYLLAALLGTISLIPSFIVYPLANVLLKNGVSIQVIAVFLSTLFMVGVPSLPLEARYYGWRTAITRNLVYLVGAIVTGTFISILI